MVHVSTLTLVWNCVATVGKATMKTVKVKFSAKSPANNDHRTHHS